MYNLPFLQGAKRGAGPSSAGAAKKPKPAGGGGGAAGKQKANAPKKGPATEEELSLLNDLKEIRKLVKSNFVTVSAKCETTIKEVDYTIADVDGARIEGFREVVEEVQKLRGELVRLERRRLLLVSLKIDYRTTKLDYYEDFLQLFSQIAMDLEDASEGCDVSKRVFKRLDSQVSSSC